MVPPLTNAAVVIPVPVVYVLVQNVCLVCCLPAVLGRVRVAIPSLPVTRPC